MTIKISYYFRLLTGLSRGVIKPYKTVIGVGMSAEDFVQTATSQGTSKWNLKAFNFWRSRLIDHEIIGKQSSDAQLLKMACPNSYFSYPKLTNADIIPSDLLVTLDGVWKRSIHLGRDVTFYRFSNIFIVKEGMVFRDDCKLVDVTKTYHSDQEVLDASIAVSQAKNTSELRVIPKAILAKSRGSSNFGHFIIEMLPRAWMARRFLDVGTWPAIIDSVSASTRRVSEQALVQAGFSRNQIIAVGPEPVFVKELIVVDGLTAHTMYLSPFVMQCLDSISETIPPGAHKKLYVPRRPATGRDFDNEPEIAAALADMGFHETATAELSFVDQIAAFKGADSIVAVSGAALTNAAFCRPGTAILNFMPRSAAEVLFWMIGEHRRLQYREVRCEETGPQQGNLPWDRKIHVHPSDLKFLL